LSCGAGAEEERQHGGERRKTHGILHGKERRRNDFIKSGADVAPLAFPLAPGAGKMALDLAPGTLALQELYKLVTWR
jgi:hypothetical protein